MPKESNFSFMLRKDIKTVYSDKKYIFKPYIDLIQDSYNSGKKSFDFYMLYYRKFFAIELKMCRQLSISFDMVKPHQVLSLDLITKSGKNFESLIVIWLYKYDSKQALIIPVNTWKKMLVHYKGSKSVKIADLIVWLSECDHKHYKMRRDKTVNGTFWDVEAILERMYNDK